MIEENKKKFIQLEETIKEERRGTTTYQIFQIIRQKLKKDL